MTHRDRIHGSYNKHSGYYRVSRISRDGKTVAEDIFHGPRIKPDEPEQKHLCFGKIVDEDIPRGKCIRLCNICGKIYEAEK